MDIKAEFLLINPYIHDFAAYNLWMRPLGLLEIYQFLFSSGHHVDYIEIMEIVLSLKKLGVKPKLAQYSPTPGTEMFDSDCQISPGIQSEPLLHNSSIGLLWKDAQESYDRLKNMARGNNP